MIIRSKYKNFYYNTNNNKIIIEALFNEDYFTSKTKLGKQYYDFEIHIREKYNINPNVFFKSENHY